MRSTPALCERARQARRTSRRERRSADRRAPRALAAAAGSRSNARSRPVGRERREDRAGVPAATERGVDVRAVRSDRQRGDGFFEQDGNVVTATHQRLKPSSSGGRLPRGERDRAGGLLLPLRVVPQLELVALPHEHDVMVEAGVLAQRGRHEDAAGAVHVDFVGVTDEEPLQSADLVVERRQPHESRLDRLPRRARVHEQASAGVGGDDERALAVVGRSGERGAMLAGNREPPLGVERELRHAAKDGGRARWIDSSLCHRDAPAGRSDSEYLCTWRASLPAQDARKSPTCTHFLPPIATIKEQKPRGQLIWVSEQST